MREIQLKSCTVFIDDDLGKSTTMYPDGTEVHSQEFDNQVAWDYGYGYIAKGRMAKEHDLIHHFVAEYLDKPYSFNQWQIAHGAEPTDYHCERDLEEALVAGFTFLLNQSKIPPPNWKSWTRTPELYMVYTEKVFDDAGKDLELAIKEFIEKYR